ncbi:MAG: DnaJ domain-containing protein [Hyphomicrobiaceae bacterium]
MSDPLHLHKIRAGAVVWNKWRRDNPSIVPDLNGLKISASELQFGAVQGGPVDFSRTELSHAVLVHATLIEANLAGAALAKADLSYARLNKADLRGADLRGAKLGYTDLADARLDGAFVCGADLRHARGLTQQQIDRALGGEGTLLPAGLHVPATWLAEDERERQRGDGQGIDSLINEYELLGVKPKASMQEIRTAWLRLVKELHPDIAADDPSANERLKAVNQAYQGLKALDQREIARRAARRPSSGTATFAVFLFLPIAATLAMAVWTHGLPIALLRDLPVVAVTEQRTGADDAALAEASLAETMGQPQEAEKTNETRTSVALSYPSSKPTSLGEVSSLSTSTAERIDTLADDDAAWARAADAAWARMADEAHRKVAALEAEARADVAWAGAKQKNAEAEQAKDVPAQTADTTRLSTQATRQEVALAEVAGREPANERMAAAADVPRVNAEHAEQADLTTHLEPRLNGRRAEAKLAGLESVVESKPTAAVAGTRHARQVLRSPGRPGASTTAQSATRWPSADEPFVAADGRIR